jgi:hypothetical protein
MPQELAESAGRTSRTLPVRRQRTFMTCTSNSVMFSRYAEGAAEVFAGAIRTASVTESDSG